LRPLTAILFKDVLIEMRSKESLSSMLMFGILVLGHFHVCVRSAAVSIKLLSVRGELWVAYSFAAILGLNLVLAMEIDNDCLQGTAPCAHRARRPLPGEGG
jgi:ABC-type transport system involved in cytochrome c biogenesis permease component